MGLAQVRTHTRAQLRAKDSGGERGAKGSENTSLRSLGINHGLDLISEIWDGNSAIKMSEGNFDDIRQTSSFYLSLSSLNMKYMR